MVGTPLIVKTAALYAPSTPVMASASTHMDLLKGEAAVQTPDCKKCLDLSSGTEKGSRPACKRCAQVGDLLQQVAEMQESVTRLQNIKETEKKIDSWFQEQPAVDPQPTAKQQKTVPLAHTEGKGANIAD